MTRAELIQFINANIYPNGRNQITAPMVRDSILAVVGFLGDAAVKDIGAVLENNTDLVTGGAVYDAIRAYLSSVMKMVGETTTDVITNPTANPVYVDGEPHTAQKGDVVVYGYKEFWWTGSMWKELGDEASWALKTISITGTGDLTGGGTLEANRTLDLTQSAKDKLAHGETAFSWLESYSTNRLRLKSPYSYLNARKGLILEEETDYTNTPADFVKQVVTVGETEYTILRSKLPIVSDSFISAGGISPGGGGGGAGWLYELGDVYGTTAVLRADGTEKQVGDVLQYYDSTKGWVAVASTAIGITTDATQSVHGLMSAADKTKLDYVGFGTAGSDYVPIYLGGSTPTNVLTAHQSLSAYATIASLGTMAYASTGDYVTKTGDTMTGTLQITKNNPLIINYTRCYAGSGGWADSLIEIRKADATTFGGVLGWFGNDNTPAFFYLGLNEAWDSANNFRIYGSGVYWGNNQIWHAGNSNSTSVAWSASSLTLNGAISGATTISASSNITGYGIRTNEYYWMNDSGGTQRTLIDRTGNTPIFGYGFSAAHYECYYAGYGIHLYAGGGYNTGHLDILTNGNVGIGNSSPTYKLDVANTAGNWTTFFHSTNSGAYLSHNDGNGAYIYSSQNSSSYYLLKLEGYAFSTGVSAMVVQSDGKVGIGTYSPTHNVSVAGGIDCYNLYNSGYFHMLDANSNWISTIDRSGNNPIFGYGQGQAGYHVFYTGRTVSINAGTDWGASANGIFISTGNYVGIGTDSPGYKLHVNGSAYATHLTLNGAITGATNILTRKDIRSDIDSIYDLRWHYGGYDMGDFHGTYQGEYPTAYGKFLSMCNGTENSAIIMMIDTPTSNACGHIYVRTRGAGDWNTSYSAWRTVVYSGDDYAANYITVGSTTLNTSAALYVYGNAVATGAVTAGSASDISFKSNIKKISAESAKSLIMAMNPVTFTWNSLATSLYDKYVGDDLGLVAQEVEPYLPMAISPIFEKYKRLDYTKLIAPIIRVEQDHETRIQQLERESREKDAKIAELENQLRQRLTN